MASEGQQTKMPDKETYIEFEKHNTKLPCPLGNPSPILGKSLTDFEKICHRLWENLPPTLGKSATDFKEICPRVWGNLSPTSGKSATNFGKKHVPLLGKTCFVLGQNMLRFWGTHAPFLGRTGSVFGTKWLRFGEKPARFGGNWFAFGIGLGLKSHCFEHKACFGLDFWVFRTGCHQNKKSQPVGSWEGKMLKPINFDVENWVLLR